VRQRRNSSPIPARTVAAQKRVEVKVKDQYLVTIRLIERLHRRFLDVIKTELDRLGIQDINNVQTLILSNISAEELTVGELTVRGYYLGSNVSYNVKKLVESGYLIQERSVHDKRQTRVRLSPKGLELTNQIDKLYGKNAEDLNGRVVTAEQLRQLNATLMGIERYWSDQIGYAR
jgi:DNA-binding MarR family transcriptional regulator